jgi:hypothetical protein
MARNFVIIEAFMALPFREQAAPRPLMRIE